MPQVREDFLLNSDGDFPLQDTVTASGVYLDTPYGNSEQQHVKDIIVSELGWIKSSPTLGFGVNKYFFAESVSYYSIEKKLRDNLEKDGYEALNGVLIPAKGSGFFIDSRKIRRVK